MLAEIFDRNFTGEAHRKRRTMSMVQWERNCPPEESVYSSRITVPSSFRENEASRVATSRGRVP